MPNYNPYGVSYDSFGQPLGVIQNVWSGIDNSLTGNTDFIRDMYQLSTQNAFNAQEAQKARDFQEYLRSTAYQATVEDMQKAGLNPYLAYSSGATSAPSTASASSASGGRNKSGGAFASIFGGLLSSLVGGAFGIAKQSMSNSFAIQKLDKEIELSDRIKDNIKRSKNQFLNSNDRKYTDKDFEEMLKRLTDDD